MLIGVLLGSARDRAAGRGQVQDLTPHREPRARLAGHAARAPTSGCRPGLVDGAHLRIAFAEAVATFAVALAALLALFRYFAGYAWPRRGGARGHPGGGRHAELPGGGRRRVDRAAGAAPRSSRSSSSPPGSTRWSAVVAFGLVLAILHQGDVATGRAAARRPRSGPSSTSRSGSRAACCSISSWVPAGIWTRARALRRAGRRDRRGQRRELLPQPLAASTPTWCSASSWRTAGARTAT